MSDECWKDVKGHEGFYQVSNLGRIRSLDRRTYRGGTRWTVLSGKTLSPRLDTKGYPRTYLYGDGKPRNRAIHHLVLEAFVGPMPAGHEVAHCNGVRNDNRLDNLRYATRSENHLDKRKHGTMVCGERINFAKLQEGQVREIRSLREQGVTLREIGQRFGVSEGAVSMIANRKTWEHVE